MDDVGTLHHVPPLATEGSIKLGDKTNSRDQNFGYKTICEPQRWNNYRI